jgi:3-hydroxyanthranilate 3,4-dioxygenase
MEIPIDSADWLDENRDSLKPPIGNKLMHRNELSVMFVGGPNARNDFHIDESSEFFFQLKGNMRLLIIECGKRRIVNIQEGNVFLLPGRIPHSPQRPEIGSIGLVIERKRIENEELDCMRWYTDFDVCDSIQFEKFFFCQDLGKDLVPVADAYRRFMETGGNGFKRSEESLKMDEQSIVTPEPFNIREWCESHRVQFVKGATISLFGRDHPDKQYDIYVSSESMISITANTWEVFIYQLSGTVNLLQDGDTHRVVPICESGCFVIRRGDSYTVSNRSCGADGLSLTLVLYCDPSEKN